MGKAEITSEFILAKVAPHFNRHGYFATSMSDITQLTGLTKGAIYGNFMNKEHLAMEAFRYNVKRVIGVIAKIVNQQSSSIDKLMCINDFYRNYLVYTKEMGGCPIVQMGMDSINNNDALTERVRSISLKIRQLLVDIIEEGQQAKEIKGNVDAVRFANITFSVIDGAILNATIMNDEMILHNSMDHLNDTVKAIATK